MVNKTSYKMTDSNISLGADKMEFNPGVIEFFEDIKDYNVSNYILSSGLKVLIAKTKVARFFDEIYDASIFEFDASNLPINVKFPFIDASEFI